jgi:glycosyltransferase involved in cell wall biosynthesis
MKIAVIDYYNAGTNPHKDSITTPLLLKALGHNVFLVSCDPTVAATFDVAGLRVQPVAHFSEYVWRRGDIDCVVAISRFDHALTELLREIKLAGVPLVVKGDTDGTLGYPLPPNYLRMCPPSGGISNLLRHLKWRLPVHHWVGQKLAHVALADRVVVESPGAAANLVQVLRYWKLEQHVAKLRIVPNQVAQEVVDATVERKKAKVILAVGRWDDFRCKGADLLSPVVSHLLGARDDYRVTIVGSGIGEVRKRLNGRNSSHVTLIDETGFSDVQRIISTARVLLVPSRLESFSFVSAEALCAGASLAATPIESLNYLAGGGAWGTISRDFSVPAITAALLCEIERWESGERDPLVTAAYWRDRLAPSATAVHWARLLSEARGEASPEPPSVTIPR